MKRTVPPAGSRVARAREYGNVRFPFLRRRARDTQSAAFTATHERLLESELRVWRGLSSHERDRLRVAVPTFVAAKRWEGCGGLTLTDEMRWTIAAQACLLLVGHDVPPFEDVRTILLYPDSFLARDPDEDWQVRTGEAHDEGKAVLSWEDARRGGRGEDRGSVVYHEFAHFLDFASGAADGAPPLEKPARAAAWRAMLRAELQSLEADLARERETVLPPSAAADDSEFFATATEYLFAHPHELYDERPRLYEALADWYQVDPRAWYSRQERPPADPLAVASDAELADEIERWSHAIERHREYRDAYLARASLYVERGELDAALADYDHALAIDSNDPETLCERGETRVELGDIEGALADFSAAITLLPEYAHAWESRALARLERDDTTAAREDALEALRLDPESRSARLALAEVHLASAEPRPALRLCEDVLAEDPADEWAQTLLDEAEEKRSQEPPRD